MGKYFEESELIINQDGSIFHLHLKPEQLADKVGNVMGCVWSHKYGSISTIRKGQLIFTASQDAVEWIKKVIIQKMQNQLALLLMLQVDTGQKELIVEEAGNKISKLIAKVDALEGFTVREIANNLRAYEGNASKEYFRALNQFIPEKYRFKERSQHPATDVANAMLNYGYGILYGKIENALIRCGMHLGPAVGRYAVGLKCGVQRLCRRCRPLCCGR